MEVDAIQSLLDAARGALDELQSQEASVRPIAWPEWSASESPTEPLHAQLAVVRVEVGRTKLDAARRHWFDQGGLTRLDCAAHDPVNLYVDNQLFARGELIAIDDHYAVRITELLSRPHPRHLKSET